MKLSSFLNNASVSFGARCWLTDRPRCVRRPPGLGESRMSTRFSGIVHSLGRVVAFTAGGVLLPLAVAHATLTISETGSTLILPLFKSWVTAYSKVDPQLQMT